MSSNFNHPIHQTRVNGRISCLALAEKIWQIFHGCNPHTQLCCSSHKCMFLTNVAPFKREINRLSNGIRLIAKKHCYNKEIIYQTQISSLFVLCLVQNRTQTADAYVVPYIGQKFRSVHRQSTWILVDRCRW